MKFIVPRKTEPSQCRDCRADIYWIDHKGRSGTVRVPVDCSPVGCAEPDSWTDGVGYHHNELCPERRD